MTLVSTPGKFLHAHSDNEQERPSLHLEESYKCPQKNVKNSRKRVSLSTAIASSGSFAAQAE